MIGFFRRRWRIRQLTLNHLAEVERLADGWADGDEQRKIMLWRKVHTSAEHLRIELGR
jgi:hypothetical protein